MLSRVGATGLAANWVRENPLDAHGEDLVTDAPGSSPSKALRQLAGALAAKPSLAAPSCFEVPEVRIHCWGKEAFEPLACRVTVDDAFLRLDVADGSVEERRRLFSHRAAPSDVLRGASSNGYAFEASRLSRFGMDRSGPRARETEVGFQAWDWRLLPASPPSLWVGRLRGLLGGGLAWHNLRFGDDVAIAMGLYLGQTVGYDYVLLRTDFADTAGGINDLLVVDTKGDGAPDPDALVRDLRTFQFLHARPVRVDVLRGATENGDLLGSFVGSCFGEYELRERFAHWPIIPDGRHCWASPCFTRLAQCARQGPPIVRLAMDYFLSSYRGSLDEAYLKLTVALEGIALEVLRRFGPRAGTMVVAEDKHWIVADVEKWKALVRDLKASSQYKAWNQLLDERASEIASHALAKPIDWSRSLSDSLKLGRDPGVLSAGRRVQAAFRSLNLELDGPMKAEVERWHGARHTGVAERADPASLADQVAVLRTMLVALLLRFVGYEGSVIGYDTGPLGLWRSADPDWWGDFLRSSDATAARLSFLVGQSDG